jgi:FlaG/FlaF family flagellin (archaellin)
MRTLRRKTAGSMRAGISPLISVVILISVVFVIAALVSPWMFELVRDVTDHTRNDTDTGLMCNNAAYDFDTSYATYGARWFFTTVNNTLNVKIRNTGTINLYNFSFELTFNDTVIEYYSATASTQRAASNPLKPGQAGIINASLTKDVNDTLTDIKVLNIVCPSIYASQAL